MREPMAVTSEGVATYRTDSDAYHSGTEPQTPHPNPTGEGRFSRSIEAEVLRDADDPRRMARLAARIRRPDRPAADDGRAGLRA